MVTRAVILIMITLGLFASRHRVSCRLDLNRGNQNDVSTEEEVKPVKTFFPDEPIQLVRPDPSHKTLVVVEDNLKVCPF